MKNENELNRDIQQITLLIQEKSPELSKYISEMPVTIPNSASPQISIKILNDYYNSLKELLIKYRLNTVEQHKGMNDYSPKHNNRIK